MDLTTATDNCLCCFCDQLITAGSTIIVHAVNPDGVLCAACAYDFLAYTCTIRLEVRP